MTLAEQLVLFALDPLRGKPAQGIPAHRLKRGAAAALLAELVLGKRLIAVGDGDAVCMLDTLPDVNPLLDEAGPLLAKQPVPVPITEAVRRLELGIRGIVPRLLDSLVGRDILHRAREAFVLHRYPLRSQQALGQVHERLRSIYEREHPDAGAIALGAIADASGVAAARMSTEDRFRMRRRLAPGHGESHGDLALIFRIAQIAGQ